MEKDAKKVPWFLWPFVAIWNLLALVLNITGRILGILLAVALMVAGVALTMTILGAPLGVPFLILGILLLIRSLF